MSTRTKVNRLAAGLGLAAVILAPAAKADDCVRSVPVPLFKANRPDIQAHRFALRSTHEAVEAFRLGANLRVKVEHGGCESVVTGIRFESPALFAHGYSDAMAYEAAAALLQRLNDARPNIGFGFDLGLARAALLTRARRQPAPALDEALPVDGDGSGPLPATVTIGAAGRHKASGHLAITFAIGPL